MFWLEEQWGDSPGDSEGSSCSSPLRERAREEMKGKQIHSFPSDKPGVPGEGRDEREMGLTQGVGEQQQRGCDHLILKPQHWGAPSAKSWQGESTELLLLLWFLTWGQGGEAQSWHPCQLLCLLASLGDSKVWIPCSEKEQKESAACLTRLGRGSGCVWLCVLTPLCFWRGVFYRKNGLGAVMERVAIQSSQWILGGVACLNSDFSCLAAGPALRTHFHPFPLAPL